MEINCDLKPPSFVPLLKTIYFLFYFPLSFRIQPQLHNLSFVFHPFEYFLLSTVSFLRYLLLFLKSFLSPLFFSSPSQFLFFPYISGLQGTEKKAFPSKIQIGSQTSASWTQENVEVEEVDEAVVKVEEEAEGEKERTESGRGTSGWLHLI